MSQPKFTSREICEILEKAVEMSLEKCMAKNRPVIIWINKHSLKREPKFHMYEMLEGVGRSIKVEFIIFNNGLVFRIIISLLNVMGQFLN